MFVADPDRSRNSRERIRLLHSLQIRRLPGLYRHSPKLITGRLGIEQLVSSRLSSVLDAARFRRLRLEQGAIRNELTMPPDFGPFEVQRIGDTTRSASSSKERGYSTRILRVRREATAPTSSSSAGLLLAAALSMAVNRPPNRDYRGKTPPSQSREQNGSLLGRAKLLTQTTAFDRRSAGNLLIPKRLEPSDPGELPRNETSAWPRYSIAGPRSLSDTSDRGNAVSYTGDMLSPANQYGPEGLLPFNGVAFAPSQQVRGQRSTQSQGQPSLSASSNTSEEAKGISSAGDLYLDGRVLGNWINRHLERALTKPSLGTTAVDPRAVAPWPGLPIPY
jgi:hypothetical protein